jgi:sterol 24-C-methyltransferase
VLKPGACFAGYEWLSTPAYNPSNSHHRAIMADIELGNGLPDVRSVEQVRQQGRGGERRSRSRRC